MTDYLDLLRADLADKEFIERIRRPAGHPRVFQIEMAGLGMLVAVCTTLANRLADEAIAAGSAIGRFDIFRPKRTAHQIAGDAGLLVHAVARRDHVAPTNDNIQLAMHHCNKRLYPLAMTCTFVRTN